MKIKLTETDIANIVRRLLIEQSQPPLADKFTYVMGLSIIESTYFYKNISMELIDIGPYYTFIPYGGQEELILIDKDTVLTNSTSDVSGIREVDEEFIRDLYSEGKTVLVGRGDVDTKLKFKNKIFNSYVKLIKRTILNSTCVVFRDDQLHRTLYVFYEPDNRPSIFTAIVLYDSGKKNLIIYNEFRDYFDLPQKMDAFVDRIIKEVFSEAFGYKGDIYFNNVANDFMDLHAWTTLESGNGKAILNTIADKI